MSTVRSLVAGTFLLSLMVTIPLPAPAQNFPGVLTSRNDLARTGQNLNETILNTFNVSPGTFGKIFSYTVDGQIYGQPLYVPNVNIPGQGTHNVIYVTTQLDSVYAFDADGLTSVPLWQDSFIDLSQGIEPVPCEVVGVDDEACSVYPYSGITGTPVIDPSTNTMYLVARTYQPSTKTGYQYLHALDITTGEENFGGPVAIQGSVPGTGKGSQNGIVPFDTLDDRQRPGLLLLNGTVYAAFSGTAHGWIIGYDASTLTQTAIFSTTPNAMRAGVWQSGNGLAADSSGYIYGSSGDGPFDANSGGIDYGDSVLKLDGNLNVVDYFTPMDQGCRWNRDMDLGSSGPLLLPPQNGSVPNEVVASGKGGEPCDLSLSAHIYILNQDNLGKYSPTSDQVVEELQGAPEGYWSSPAFWQGPTNAYIYYSGSGAKDGVGDYLKMYEVTNGQVSTEVAQSVNIFPVGSTPSISASGTTNGIVWAIERQEALGVRPGELPAILYAFDATNVATLLYNSAENPQTDQGGCANKFQTATIANGKVYVATQNEVDIFGLLGSPAPAPWVYLSGPCNVYAGQTVGTSSTPWSLTLTNSGNDSLSIGNIAIGGMNPGDFSETNNCPATLTAGSYCTIQVTFAPTAVGPRIAQVLITENSAGSPHSAYLTGTGTPQLYQNN
jgi:hypothetical protein